MKKSFTLIEVILAVLLLALMLGIGIFAFQGGQLVSDVLRTETDTVISTLRRAQALSLFSGTTTDVSVRFEPQRLTISPSGEVVSLSGVTVSQVELSGSDAVSFSRKNGVPSPSGRITLTGPRGGTRTVIISPSGSIDWTSP